MLTLTVPEMTVSLGGLRVLNVGSEPAKAGVLTNKPGVLSNDFFVNLLDMSTKWSKSKGQKAYYTGKDRSSGRIKWTASPVDLAFGSSSELRSIVEVYASDDGHQKFMNDFVRVWVKVMNLGRY